MQFLEHWSAAHFCWSSRSAGRSAAPDGCPERYLKLRSGNPVWSAKAVSKIQLSANCEAECNLHTSIRAQRFAAVLILFQTVKFSLLGSFLIHVFVSANICFA